MIKNYSKKISNPVVEEEPIKAVHLDLSEKRKYKDKLTLEQIDEMRQRKLI